MFAAAMGMWFPDWAGCGFSARLFFDEKLANPARQTLLKIKSGRERVFIFGSEIPVIVGMLFEYILPCGYFLLFLQPFLRPLSPFLPRPD
jgi:hypothetical protein